MQPGFILKFYFVFSHCAWNNDLLFSIPREELKSVSESGLFFFFFPGGRGRLPQVALGFVVKAEGCPDSVRFRRWRSPDGEWSGKRREMGPPQAGKQQRWGLCVPLACSARWGWLCTEALRVFGPHLWSSRGLLWIPLRGVQGRRACLGPDWDLTQGSGATAIGVNYHGNHKAQGLFSWVPDSSVTLENPPEHN